MYVGRETREDAGQDMREEEHLSSSLYGLHRIATGIRIGSGVGREGMGI